MKGMRDDGEGYSRPRKESVQRDCGHTQKRYAGSGGYRHRVGL